MGDYGTRRDRRCFPRTELYDTFKQSKAAPDPSGDPYACLFDNADYDKARALVVGKVAPVSLMALGEWLVVSILHPKSRPQFDVVAGIAQGALATYGSADPAFYRTLGAAIVDNEFRSQFNQTNERNYGFNLNGADRNALSTVIGDGGFNLQTQKLHDDNWPDGCKDMLIQSTGHPYAHALEAKF